MVTIFPKKVVHILLKKRVKAHIVEAILAVLIGLFCLTAVFVTLNALTQSQLELMFSVIIVLFILLFVGLLGLILVLVKIWERLGGM